MSARVLDFNKDYIFEVSEIKKYFPVDDYKFAKSKIRYLHAVDNVSFKIRRGEIFGIIGESGSGKSTIGRCLLGLHTVDAGDVYFNGEEISRLGRRELKKYRPHMQMIFQNPLASFNPKMTIAQALYEVAKVYKMDKALAQTQIKEQLQLIKLNEDVLGRLPKELSGGQLQRLAIARALMLNPEFLLADEPVSALDVSVQAQILNLMADLRDDYNRTILFISHDLTVVRHICDTVAVVYLGVIVEMGEVGELYKNVRHPYTKALISAKPKEHPQDTTQRILLEGDMPSAIDVPEGCRFANRCSRFKKGLCSEQTPKLKKVGTRHWVACHYPEE